ncbi:hypothetical protein Bxe_A2465 [Paraburkholderia xenovorans LB400]|uniref:Uncharacterized protein n=1 Tax=Paraburkholderia xenovorans (strain LB400) TaxID=266265 RepID=Q13ZI1_PARXL|nr:hypothetical protein Bxe_A2465 [Paraburkholderia xenovorans LB400]
MSQWLRERNWRITSKRSALDAPSPRAQKVHGVCEHQNKDPQVYCVRQVERSPSRAEPSRAEPSRAKYLEFHLLFTSLSFLLRRIVGDLVGMPNKSTVQSDTPTTQPDTAAHCVGQPKEK